MKLFYAKGACSLVVRIIINEIGLNAEYESVNLKTKSTEKNQDFYQINPKGAVPALQINEHEILTENAVILQYLADHSKATQLLPSANDFKRYRVLEWLNYMTTELHKGFSPLFNPSLPQAIKEEFFIPAIKAKFSYVNKRLQDTTYLMGEEFTLPDAYLFVMLTWAAHAHINLKEFENLDRYLTLLRSRESIQKSLKQEKES